MKLIPSMQRIRQSWEKYGLIVIGNVVFFVLLYFISYRPHNDENRAAEFLSMAQQEETEDNWRTAMILYKKVVSDYVDTRSAQTAKARIGYLQKHPPIVKNVQPKVIEPILDIEKMLARKPSVYMAKFLAKHYEDRPALKPKLKQFIGEYLKIAINYDGVLLKTLRAEKEFQTDEFQKNYFKAKLRCQMKSDWLYDDFFVKNMSIFPLHNVRIQLQVSQGEEKAQKEIRVPLLKPGLSVEVLSFRVQKGGGDAFCTGTVKAREGTAKVRDQM